MQRASEKRQLEALVIAKGKTLSYITSNKAQPPRLPSSSLLLTLLRMRANNNKNVFPCQANSRCQSVAMPKLARPDRL
jgi:hypothetical protein